MKRDMDLIRQILFYIEENYRAGQGAINISIEGHTDGEIFESCQLAYQDGLIEKPLDSSTMMERSCMANGLTSAGYDFLDKIREDTVWNKTKKVLKDKGLPMLVNTIRSIATAIISAAAEGATNAIIKNGGATHAD